MVQRIKASGRGFIAWQMSIDFLKEGKISIARRRNSAPDFYGLDTSKRQFTLPGVSCRPSFSSFGLRMRRPKRRSGMFIDLSHSFRNIDGNPPPFPGRLINRLHYRNVAKTLDAVRLRVLTTADAVSESIQFESKLIDHLETLLKPAAADLPEQPPLFFVRERRVKGCPAFFPKYFQEIGLGRPEAGACLQDKIFREFQLKADVLFNAGIVDRIG